MFNFLRRKKPAEEWELLAVDSKGHAWTFRMGDQPHLDGSLTVIEESQAILAQNRVNSKVAVFPLKSGDEVPNAKSGFAPFRILGVVTKFRRLSGE